MRHRGSTGIVHQFEIRSIIFIERIFLCTSPKILLELVHENYLEQLQ
jgi:hypothetical protein